MLNPFQAKPKLLDFMKSIGMQPIPRQNLRLNIQSNDYPGLVSLIKNIDFTKDIHFDKAVSYDLISDTILNHCKDSVSEMIRQNWISNLISNIFQGKSVHICIKRMFFINKIATSLP